MGVLIAVAQGVEKRRVAPSGGQDAAALVLARAEDALGGLSNDVLEGCPARAGMDPSYLPAELRASKLPRASEDEPNSAPPFGPVIRLVDAMFRLGRTLADWHRARHLYVFTGLPTLWVADRGGAVHSRHSVPWRQH